VLAGVVDVYPRRLPRPPIVLRRREIARILGAEISGEEVERILRGLDFGVEVSGAEGWRVALPSFRPDVSREVDLIEEVARHYGYDRLPSRLRPAPPRVESDAQREKEHTVTGILTALGYREIIPSSLISPEENARFTDRPPVELANPLSADASVLRSTAVPSLVRALKWNLDRARDDVRLFETGRTYTPAGDELPREDRVLTLGLTGRRRAKSVHDDEARADFFDLKGDLETLFEAFELPALEFEPKGCAYYEAERAGQFAAAGETLARFGRLSSILEREYKLRQPVFVAEVDLDRLLAAPLRARTFKPFSRFPAVERDFSLVIPEGVSYALLAESLRGAGIPELHDVRPVDYNPSDRLPPGTLPPRTYSLLLRANFQSHERTLTSEEAEEFGRRLLAALEPLGVRLRS
jgi:phenylalanyl-tRNA synthetase beta chain